MKWRRITLKEHCTNMLKHTCLQSSGKKNKRMHKNRSINSTLNAWILSMGVGEHQVYIYPRRHKKKSFELIKTTRITRVKNPWCFPQSIEQARTTKVFLPSVLRCACPFIKSPSSCFCRIKPWVWSLWPSRDWVHRGTLPDDVGQVQNKQMFFLKSSSF